MYVKKKICTHIVITFDGFIITFHGLKRNKIKKKVNNILISCFFCIKYLTSDLSWMVFLINDSFWILLNFIAWISSRMYLCHLMVLFISEFVDFIGRFVLILDTSILDTLRKIELIQHRWWVPKSYYFLKKASCELKEHKQ